MQNKNKVIITTHTRKPFEMQFALNRADVSVVSILPEFSVRAKRSSGVGEVTVLRRREQPKVVGTFVRNS